MLLESQNNSEEIKVLSQILDSLGDPISEKEFDEILNFYDKNKIDQISNSFIDIVKDSVVDKIEEISINEFDI